MQFKGWHNSCLHSPEPHYSPQNQTICQDVEITTRKVPPVADPAIKATRASRTQIKENQTIVRSQPAISGPNHSQDQLIRTITATSTWAMQTNSKLENAKAWTCRSAITFKTFIMPGQNDNNEKDISSRDRNEQSGAGSQDSDQNKSNVNAEPQSSNRPETRSKTSEPSTEVEKRGEFDGGAGS